MSQSYLRHSAFIVLAFILLAVTDRRNEVIALPKKESADKPFPIWSVVAIYPGAAPEEVEHKVTVPLELSLAGIKGLESVRSTSRFGRCDIYARFKPGTDFAASGQEVINRLQLIQQLPAGVFPQLSPLPTCEVLRYVLNAPHNASGKSIYAMHDLRALQDWVLERQFRRVPRVVDIESFGGTVKRYEIQIDPDRMRRMGVTLEQIQAAVVKNNENASDYVVPNVPDYVVPNVRNVGLLGGGNGPFERIRTLKDPDAKAAKELEEAEREKKPEAAGLREAQRRRLAVAAAKILREDETKRIREIRNNVIGKANDVAVRVEDIVVGGRIDPDKPVGEQGVNIGNGDPSANVVQRSSNAEDQVVQGVVYFRRDEDPREVAGVLARIKELNASADTLLPGVQIAPIFSRDEKADANLRVYGFPASETKSATSREIAATGGKILGEFLEVHRVVSQVGGMDAENEPIQFYIGLKSPNGAPDGKPFRRHSQLIEEFRLALRRELPKVDWLVTPKDPIELQQAFPGIIAEHLIKIVGPDLAELERLATPIQNALREVTGIENVSVVPSKRTQLEFHIDLEKCKKWGVSAADVNKVLQSAVGGKAFSSMIEGEKIFDITLRLPVAKGTTEILDVPVDIIDNKVEPKKDVANPLQNRPRIRLRDVVTASDPNEKAARPGFTAIYREQGKRVLPIRFSIKDRPLADIRRDAIKKIEPLLKSPYRIEID